MAAHVNIPWLTIFEFITQTSVHMALQPFFTEYDCCCNGNAFIVEVKFSPVYEMKKIKIDSIINLQLVSVCTLKRSSPTLGSQEPM